MIFSFMYFPSSFQCCTWWQAIAPTPLNFWIIKRRNINERMLNSRFVWHFSNDFFICVFSLSFQCCTRGQAIAPLPLHIAPIGPGACSAPVPTLKLDKLNWIEITKRIEGYWTPCYPVWCTGGIECRCRRKEKRTAARCEFDTPSHNFARILMK